MRYLSVFTVLAVLGTAMALLPRDSSDGRMTRGNNSPPAMHQQLVDGRRVEALKGTWEVTSVQRDGKPDLSQVGARLTFMDNRVTFWPKPLELKVFDSSGTEMDITNLPDHERASLLHAVQLLGPSNAQTIFQPNAREFENQFS